MIVDWLLINADAIINRSIAIFLAFLATLIIVRIDQAYGNHAALLALGLAIIGIARATLPAVRKRYEKAR